jgi:hypothetical protein
MLKGDVDPMSEAQRATAEAEAEIGDSAATNRTASTTTAKTPAGAATSTAAGTPKARKKPVGQSADATR